MVYSEVTGAETSPGMLQITGCYVTDPSRPIGLWAVSGSASLVANGSNENQLSVVPVTSGLVPHETLHNPGVQTVEF